VLAHPGYVKVFAPDLTTPGIRVPLTASADLFARAVAVGRRVLWLHAYGQRLTDPSDQRPRRVPRLPSATAPKVLAEHPIPSDPDGMPDQLDYDPATQQVQVGSGRIGNVTPRMWGYDISGVNVLGKWFSYRRKNRERPVMGDRRVSHLQAIQPDRWLAEYTAELIDLLNVLGLLIELEPAQHTLLTKIATGPIISTDELTAAGILPVPLATRKPPPAVSSTEATLLGP
jgi:Type ISP C-terminal specificity domain